MFHLAGVVHLRRLPNGESKVCKSRVMVASAMPSAGLILRMCAHGVASVGDVGCGEEDPTSRGFLPIGHGQWAMHFVISHGLTLLGCESQAHNRRA